jgi:hypothetical protein
MTKHADEHADGTELAIDGISYSIYSIIRHVIKTSVTNTKTTGKEYRSEEQQQKIGK